jgi:hypothetical protein
MMAQRRFGLGRNIPSAWTMRQIAHHVAGVTYYAHQVGDLAGP